MIRFACPTCRKTLSAPEQKAGATVKCPGCQTALQIPYPPAATSVQASPPPPSSAAQPKKKVPIWAWVVGVPMGMMFLCCGGCTMLGIIGSLGDKSERSSSSSPSPSSSSASGASVPVSNLAWQEIDSIYNLQSNTTELQKKEEWKKYKGKRIKWTGRVSEVGETFGTLQLQIKMNQSTLTSDLIISLKDNQRAKGLKLRQGDSVTFVGTLRDWGTLLPISLTDGEIMD